MRLSSRPSPTQPPEDGRAPLLAPPAAAPAAGGAAPAGPADGWASLRRTAAPWGDRLRRLVLSAGEHQYVRGRAAMVAGACGGGAQSGGLFLLVSTLAQRLGGQQVAAALLAITAAEGATYAAATLLARRLRQTAAAPVGVGQPLPPPPRRLAWVMVACGVTDAMQSLCLVGAALGLSRRADAPAAWVVLGGISRAVGAAAEGVSRGTWSDLRIHLAGPTPSGAAHPRLSAAAHDLEGLWFACGGNLTALAAFFAGQALGRAERALLGAALGIMSLGAALGGLAKLTFLIEAQRPEELAAPSAGEASPA